MMNATDVAKALVDCCPDALLVSSLGTATSALRSASADGPHFYLGGAMGSAAATALGIADALPERQVVALVGDGELLMGASTLWSISALARSNFLVVVLADGHYSITGSQPIALETRYVEVAQALRNVTAARAHSIDELSSLLSTHRRPALLEAVLTDRTWPGCSPFVNPHRVAERFAASLASRATGPGTLSENDRKPPTFHTDPLAIAAEGDGS
jgi:thiamine pyrophosphate-dependent acetolactate synthase large subunit-like protein